MPSLTVTTHPRYPLSMKICKTEPSNCEQLDRVFSYMKDWTGGECGSVDSDWCVNGEDFVSGTEERYYAYCVQQTTQHPLYYYNAVRCS